MFNVVRGLFAGSVAGKVIGLVRELLLAFLYGTSAPVGAIRVAQTAVLVPVNFFSADALNAGFVPLYKRYHENNPPRAETLFWALFIILGFVSIGISLAIRWYADWWSSQLAPGMEEGAAGLAADFLRVMAWGVPFYMAGSLFSYLEVGRGGYLLAAIRPTIQSLGLIGGILAAFWTQQLVLMAWGFVISYGLFALLGVHQLVKKKYLDFPNTNLIIHLWPVLSALWKTVRPLLPIPFLLQGNTVIERAIASLVSVDAIAALDYAKYITETCILLLAVPIGLAGLSSFSTLDRETLENRLGEVVSLILAVAVPVSLFLAMYSEPAVRLLYGRGAFGETSVIVTSDIVWGLALGLWAQVGGYVLMKALNAQVRNREVMLFMLIALGANILINILLYQYLGAAVLGIGASTYGLILFVAGVWFFNLCSKIKRAVMWLAMGSGVWIIFDQFFEFIGGGGFFLSSIIFLVFWLVYLYLVPELKVAVNPLWRLLVGRRM